MSPTEAKQLARLAAALARNAEAGAEPVADAVVHAWTLVESHLAPVIGPAGVAALYRRALQVCARRHPALGDAVGAERRTLDAGPLRAMLAAQPADVAAALGAETLLTFDELLSRLVGASLTERLLRPVWQAFPGPEPTQDPRP